MKRSYLIALCIVIVSLLWILSGTLTADSDVSASADIVDNNQELFEVRVREINAEPVISNVVVTGRTYASRFVQLKSETEGQVIEIFYEKGSAVLKDQVIVKIEEQDRAERVTEAQGRLSQREIEFNAAKELQNKGFDSKVRLSQASADLEQARAELKKAEVELSQTELLAPFEGIIFEQKVELGDYVTKGDVLVNIVDLDPIEVRGFITEHQLGDVKRGKEAQVEFIDGTKKIGKVTYTAPAVDDQTRTYELEVTLDSPGHQIADGMTSKILIPKDVRMAHKISPSVLSLDDEGVVGVKSVNAQNVVEFTPVTIIEDQPEFMLVGGLPEKVKLITVGQDFVTTGQKVKPVNGSGDSLL